MTGHRGPSAITARAHWFMIAIVAAGCAILWSGEHIPGSGGLGFLYDGVTYAAIVKDPAIALHDEYYIHRALPSWVVHLGLRALGLPRTDANIINGFLALSGVLLITCAALWRPIADRLALGVHARWIGFVGLFGNFAIAKMPFYSPVFTDTFAFTLGMVVVLASLSGRRWLLALAVLGCTFAWPIGGLLAAPLLLWPSGRMAPPAPAERAPLAVLSAVMTAGAFLAWFVWLYVVRGQMVRASHHAVPVVPGVVWIGIAGAVAYIFYAVRSLLSGVTMRYVIASLRAVDPIGVALVVGTAIPSAAIAALFGNDEPRMGMRQFVGNVVLFSSSRPFLFVFSTVAYFGPVLLLLLDRRVRYNALAAIRTLGPGWILLAVATVGLSLNSESRQSIFQFPAVIALLALGADRSGVGTRVVACMAALAVIMSKVWLPINVDPTSMVDTTDPRMTFHYRRYFMNHGPWMSNEAYIINAIMVAVAAAAVWWVIRSSLNAHRTLRGSTLPVRVDPG